MSDDALTEWIESELEKAPALSNERRARIENLFKTIP